MPTADELLQTMDDVISGGVGRGMMHNVAEDARLDGRLITVHGQPLVNFGSCSYLGLEMHPALKAAVVDAVDRFGTQFSSSRAYVSAPAYQQAEEALTRLFGRPTIIAPSTTLGHLAALPTLVGTGDALVMDHQAHHSVQTAAKLAQARGSTVELVPHSDLGLLAERVAELARTHDRVWYAADGLYSMYADFAPIAELNELMDTHDQLWLYLDDAHSVSWTGRHGRGHVLERLSPAALARCVVAGSLNKSFAAAGGALTFPDEETRRRVFTVGGPLIFSGPVQPPMLGAVLASARLHLSPELPGRQARLLELIRLFNRLAAEAGLPVVSFSEAPIRYVGAGTPEVAYNVTARMRAAGYFLDTATFPAVAAKRSGARLTITTHQTEEDIAGVVEALARALPGALADEGSSVEILERSFARQLQGRPVTLRVVPPMAVAGQPALRLESHTSIDTVDPQEWDALLGDRGSFSWQGLRTLEDAFAGPRAEPEHAWAFHYWIVRDQAAGGRPVAATFFTTALWKDDMLSASEVSLEVERRRAVEPYYLTSKMLAMGSLLTDGNHLFLDRDADWRSALRLILQAARAEEDGSGAASVVLRDLPDGDAELHDLLLGEGFVRVPALATWVREIDFADDEQFVAGLTPKGRRHQRHQVLPWEDRYRVTVIPGGSAAAAALPSTDLDHLYQLYRNVHARSVELNVFPLPRRLLDAIAGNPGWELLVLRLADGPDQPVAFAAQYVTGEHVAPVFLGLDYDYVASHHAYQQTLWQFVRSAQRHGARRLLLGMSAEFQKARFGAVPERRWIYVQPTESYNLDVLSRIAERLAVA